MRPRKAAVIFIFITVTLNMLALGLIAPVWKSEGLSGFDQSEFGKIGAVIAAVAG